MIPKSSKIHLFYDFRDFPIYLWIGNPLKIMQIISRVNFRIFNFQRKTPGTHSTYDFCLHDHIQAQNKKKTFSEFSLSIIINKTELKSEFFILNVF